MKSKWLIGSASIAVMFALAATTSRAGAESEADELQQRPSPPSFPTSPKPSPPPIPSPKPKPPPKPAPKPPPKG